MAGVRVANINKHFGAMKALDDVSLDFADGEFFGLLGPSGSGKTTLLRVIAGFLFADSGSVVIGDQPVERVPVEKREIGMVFQNYALFPNMSIADNVGFGLRVRKQSRAEIARNVAQALELVQLGHLGERRPHQLSGGQRQRVALARAIVTQPRVLLLDEPLSALDKALRVDMQIELKRIQREVGITTIFVTHDQEEALTLSDRIGILKDGRLVQTGTPHDMYHAPVNEFAAGFLGEANIFKGAVGASAMTLADGSTIRWADHQQDARPPGAIAVRPESVIVSAKRPDEHPHMNCLKASIRQKIFAGPTVTYLLEWQDQPIKILAKEGEMKDIPDAGDVWINWPAEKSIAIPAG
ncbi:MAG: ABC transporter ATP-binding protein [Alphaproteobacteria bacterium]|nr:ABC transporter ATP-binding protein [Alphaproteobacteria bacterium]